MIDLPSPRQSCHWAMKDLLRLTKAPQKMIDVPQYLEDSGEGDVLSLRENSTSRFCDTLSQDRANSDANSTKRRNPRARVSTLVNRDIRFCDPSSPAMNASFNPGSCAQVCGSGLGSRLQEGWIDGFSQFVVAVLTVALLQVKLDPYALLKSTCSAIVFLPWPSSQSPVSTSKSNCTLLLTP